MTMNEGTNMALVNIESQKTSHIRINLNGEQTDVSFASYKTLLEVLREALGLKRSQLELLAGETSRDKRFLIRGLTRAELENRVARASPRLLSG